MHLIEDRAVGAVEVELLLGVREVKLHSFD
jgi:hypothetical protein